MDGQSIHPWKHGEASGPVQASPTSNRLTPGGAKRMYRQEIPGAHLVGPRRLVL